MDKEEKKLGFASKVKNFLSAAIGRIDRWYCKLPWDKVNGKLGTKIDFRSGKFKKILAASVGAVILLLLIVVCVVGGGSGKNDSRENYVGNGYPGVRKDVLANAEFFDKKLVGAFKKEDYDQVEQLIGSGKLSAETIYNLFIFAAKNGHCKLGTLLIKNGSPVEDSKEIYVEADLYRSPLYLALKNRHRPFVELLLEKGAKTNDVIRCLFHKDDFDSLELLKSCGCKIGRVGRSDIEAILTLNPTPRALQFLIDTGMDVNLKDDNGGSFLMTCIVDLNIPTETKKEMIKKLLAAKIDVENCYNVLDRVMSGSSYDQEFCRFLVENDFPYSDHSPVLAVERNDLKLAEFFLKNSPELRDSKNQAGETLLHIAVKNGNLEMVKLLVEKGVPLNARRSNGLTALDLAKDEDIRRYLKSKGATGGSDR